MKKSIEDEVFKITMSSCSSKESLEFFICSTNELNPHREIKEVGVVMIINGEQFDGDLEIDELDNFISYLNKTKRYIKKFNAESKPTQ